FRESCKEEDSMSENQKSTREDEEGKLSIPSISINEILRLPANELLQRLKTSMNGLSSSEVEICLNIYGIMNWKGGRREELY
ncbi:MAG: hypothetical protein NDF57_03770, partial [archaeon GBS-70-058]|nr:hypothetical protein [Candidatus Culexarchaeum nevadense]